MGQKVHRVAVLQSNYIPWKGYFDIIAKADTFVFYDDVQYTKNDWRNRNQIKTAQGLQWLTIPVGTNLDRRICDVTILNRRWQLKHLTTIRQAYAKAACAAECAPLLELLYLHHEWNTLSDLNQFSIRTIARDWLGLDAHFRSSAEFVLDGHRNARLLCLLQQLNTDVYISGPSAQSYLDEAAFASAGIRIEYMDYSTYPEYKQPHPPFCHHVSILDTLLCLGSEARHMFHP